MTGPAPDPQERQGPERLEWILSHNMQIRGSHRSQIADCAESWRADRAELAAVRAQLEEAERLNHKWLIDYGMLAKSKAAAEADLAALRAENARYEQDRKELDAAYDAKFAEVTVLQAERDEMEQEITVLHNTCGQYEKQLAEARARLVVPKT